MSYTALYRKFRPSGFEDVKGQDPIVTTLKNQIKADRIGHAYLFCGTRGTGKTSVAKILAKAVNCESPRDGSPCNECSMCRAITSQTSMNVIEIDAASNNGVDNVREIVDEVQYSPTAGRYKVYIIDEVHMLSTGAFNALLKTLEEPPSYVIFILATTEAHKIPITILSRCQRYDFKRITVDVIAERLKDLAGKEGIEAEEKALRYVAKAADGSMRDALSLLDQCIAFYFGETLTYDRALDVLGAVDTEVFSELFGYILEDDLVNGIGLLDRMITDGREIGQFITDFTWYLRNMLLVKTSGEASEAVDVSSENLKLLRRQGAGVDMDTLLRYIRICSELSSQVKYAAQKRVMAEIALIKLCRPAMETGLDSILDRIRVIEKKLENGAAVPGPEPKAKQGEAKKETKAPPDFPRALPEELEETAKSWALILESVPPVMKGMLAGATPTAGRDGSLLLVFEDETARAFINREDKLEELKEAIRDRTHREVLVRTCLTSGREGNSAKEADIAKLFHMDVEIED